MHWLKKKIHDFHHYAPLISIILAGVLGIIIFSYDRSFQMVVTLATALGYILWGLVHHHIHQDLYFSVFMEYLLIALLGIAIAFSVLWLH